MRSEPRITVEYDDLADVLYVSKWRERGVRFEPDGEGLVWRLSVEDDEPLGVTIIDYKEAWMTRREELAKRLAKCLRLPLRQAQRAIEDANQQAT